MLTERQRRVFDVVKAKVIEVMIDLDPALITPDGNLTELGANSVDRVEIAMLAMEELDVRVPRVELAEVRDLRGLVTLLSSHWRAAPGS
nr:phosphopantetheine-binding protein [uncultured Rhodopila sp.]